jgi:surface carbohydrate biosynthesis protein
MGTQIVLIHVDAMRREYVGAWILSELLKKNGYRVILTARHSTRRLIKKFNVSHYISTHVYQHSPEDWLVFKKRGIKLYVAEVEGIDFEDGWTDTYPTHVGASKIDYSLFDGFFVWSSASKKWLAKTHGISQTQIFITGSIRQSKYIRQQKEITNKVIGFISRFEVINTFDSRHVFENLMKLDPESPQDYWYFDRCFIDAEVFALYVKIIKRLVKLGYVVSIRPHPNESTNAYDLVKKMFGDKVQIDDSYGITEWLAKVSTVISTSSTAFTDAYLLKKRIVSLTKIQKHHFRDPSQKDLYSRFDRLAYVPSTIDDLVNFISCSDDNYLDNPLGEEHLKSYYSIDPDTDPADSMLKIISSVNGMSISNSTYYSIFLWVFFIDILALLKMSLSIRPVLKTKNFINYNYNRLLHRPTNFMLSLKKSLDGNARGVD